MISEQESFQGVDGKPIVNGYIYVGVAGQDPKLNPVNIYSDRGLTTLIANPQRTDAYGRAVNKVWVSGRYSVKVEDRDGVQKYQDLQRGELADSPTINLVNVQGINAVTADAVPAVSSYIDKAVYVLTVVNSNTGAVTLDFGGGAKAVEKNNGDPLVAGDWPAGSIQRVTYNAFSNRFDTLTFSTVEINQSIALFSTTIRNIGEPFPVWDHITGCPLPSNDATATFIKLTAGEDGIGEYNEGLLTSESISGTAPNIVATAVISHAPSPMNGQTVKLINSSRQFVRPGESGVGQGDQLASHNHPQSTLSNIREASNNTAALGSVCYVSQTTFTAYSGGLAGGDETRPSNVGATYYMRIA